MRLECSFGRWRTLPVLFEPSDLVGGQMLDGVDSEAFMAIAADLMKRAEMFENRAVAASDPISRQHYREMAAHYRTLAVEHLAAQPEKAST